MGVTLCSKNHFIDLGYAGFFRLRRKIAELISEEAGEHYAEIQYAHAFPSEEAEEEYWDAYDKETERIANSLPKYTWKVFDFLYMPDADGSVTYGTCKNILRVIGSYDDDILYGYAGRPDCARWKDFVRILKDCVETKTEMCWY